jgi:hypothetical protein
MRGAIVEKHVWAPAFARVTNIYRPGD